MRTNTQIVFKTFVDVNGLPKFFKHAHDGSRDMPLDEWIVNYPKRVRDGSGSKYYMSGFHVFSYDSELRKWADSLKIFSDRVCVPVIAQEVVLKPYSKYGLYLAGAILLPSTYWNMRTPILTI